MIKLKTGIIGCGKVAHTHARVLSRIPESSFTAVFSRSTERGAAFAAEYGVKAYTDLQELLNHLDMIIICTPHPFHTAPAVQAAETGVHVLVEKPLASSLTHCDAMISAAGNSRVKLGTISQRRFYSPVMRVKKAVESGKIGEPVLGMVTMLGWRDQAYYNSDEWRGTWKGEGGGVLVNQAPHQLDLLQWYMGPIDELFGYWENLNHPYIEVDDTAIAVIRFKNGALGSITVSNAQKPGIYGKVHVHGKNGASVGVQTDSGAMFIAGMTTIADPPLNDLWTVPGEKEMLAKWEKEDSDFFKTIDATEYYHELQIRDFLTAVIDNREPAVTGQEGRKTVELLTAIYRANRDRKPVKFPLKAEDGHNDFDGRLHFSEHLKRRYPS